MVPGVAVSIRQHTSAYVSMKLRLTPAYVSMKLSLTPACVSMKLSLTPQKLSLSTYVSIRQHTSAYVSIRQHTSAYISVRQHEQKLRLSTSRCLSMAAATLGTQFTCFTGAKVQILTLIRRAPRDGGSNTSRFSSKVSDFNPVSSGICSGSSSGVSICTFVLET
jgi:hypothetical protein